MDGLTTSAAGLAAVVSAVFWLLYSVMLMVEQSGKVPYTGAYKAIGLATGVLQAAPIFILVAFGLNLLVMDRSS